MSDSSTWAIEKLHKRHERADFSCGVPQLDEYLCRFASQNEKTGISRHFVALAPASGNKILGYYSISVGSVTVEQVPDDIVRRLPRYPIPVAHLGRLAVDLSMQGRGLGEDLLMDALARIVHASNEIGVHAVEVLAINDRARRFYLKYGFVSLVDDPCHMYLPIFVARKLDLI